MDNQHHTHLPCRLCGTAAYVPPIVDGGDHKHYQVVCNECGIEVCRLSAAEALDVWNRLMRPNVRAETPTPAQKEQTMNTQTLAAGGGRFERGVRPLALLVACLLAGCGVDAVSTAPTDNAQIKVERLFDHDGCTVYRFNDSGPRYFVKCRGGSTSTEWSESYPCGKSMCRRDVAVPGA